jgi:hypothetical protein
MSRDENERKGGAASPARPAVAPTAADDDGRELDAQIALYLKIGLPAATAIGGVVAGVTQGAAAVILVLCAGALVSVIALFWSSIRTLVGETPLSGADAYALGAPRAEEEQKRAVLRALKDLEFERSVGKISEEDYKALVAKYRADAKRLLRTLDEDAEPRRQKAADLVAERLFKEGLGDQEGPGAATVTPPPTPGEEERYYPRPAPVTAPPATKAPKKKGKPKKGKPATAPAKAEAPAKDEAKPACSACATRNDVDATFCKKCGARLDADGDEGDEEPVAEAKPKEESAS